MLRKLLVIVGVLAGSGVAAARTHCVELANGVKLPARGPGYLIPKTWAQRGLSWGSRDLVGLSQRAARRVAREVPGSTLYIGDLSPRLGGATQWHKSHRHGRDADLIFYAVDDQGRPVKPPAEMRSYNASGSADGGKLRFDTRRNWALVRALLEDRKVSVRYLFIADPLRRKLLDYAETRHEPARLIDKAAEVLHQPMDSSPHDDHLHLRILGPLDDHEPGCHASAPRAHRGRPGHRHKRRHRHRR